MIGEPVTDKSRLRNEGAVGVALQREVRLRRIMRVAMLVERYPRDRSDDRVDVRDVQVGGAPGTVVAGVVAAGAAPLGTPGSAAGRAGTATGATGGL